MADTTPELWFGDGRDPSLRAGSLGIPYRQPTPGQPIVPPIFRTARTALRKPVLRVGSDPIFAWRAWARWFIRLPTSAHRSRIAARALRNYKRSRKPLGVLAVILAVTTAEFGGDGWESNHPGRLNSAPQTVLKTANQASADVHHRPPNFRLCRRDSAVVRCSPQPSVGLAVFLAVSGSPTSRAGGPLTTVGWRPERSSH